MCVVQACFESHIIYLQGGSQILRYVCDYKDPQWQCTNFLEYSIDVVNAFLKMLKLLGKILNPLNVYV